MSVIEELSQFVREVFKTSLHVFLEALKLSPSAQGYVGGAVSELLLKDKLEREYGLEVLRIKEKWEGEKHPRHHGDFYFRQPESSDWFVMESKGVKSNSEKWHKLYNADSLERFLIKHADKIDWLGQDDDPGRRIRAWIDSNLPMFRQEYQSRLYEYEEVRKYFEDLPGRKTEKMQAMVALKNLTRAELSRAIKERLEYVMSRVRVVETHFVSGTSATSVRTQATPRRDEFAAVAIDVVLRYSEHKFLFASPKELPPSESDPEHLRQNDVMGFVFVDDAGEERLSLDSLWHEDFSPMLRSLTNEDSVDESDMQVDVRSEALN